MVSPVLPGSSGPPHSTCFGPGPLKGPLVLRTEPRALVRATPPPHILSILPHGRVEPLQALQPSLLSPAAPVFRTEPSPASSSPCSGAARGPRFLACVGSCRSQDRAGAWVPHLPLPVPPSTSGSSLFRGGGSWVRTQRCSAHQVPCPAHSPPAASAENSAHCAVLPRRQAAHKPPGPLGTSSQRHGQGAAPPCTPPGCQAGW